MRRLLALLVIVAACSRSTKPAKVVFVCEHGSAKSVVAAAHFQRLAEKRGLRVEAVARGVTPDTALSASARSGLRDDGIDVGDMKPLALTPSDTREAKVVVSFGQDVRATVGDVPVRRWDDAPAVSEDYARARDYILAREAALLDELQARP
jgi:protein-tyrosine-phosphatase